MKDFFLKYIFFKVKKEDKTYVKNRVMATNHTSFKAVLIAIFIFQLAMMLFTIISTGGKFDNKKIFYMACYSTLAVVMIITYFLIELFYKQKRANAYFYTAAVVVNIFYIWALCITLIDSYGRPNITTFSYVSLALSSFIILEPWVIILDAVCYATLLNILIGVLPNYGLYNSIILSSISIALLTCIIGVANFIRHLKHIELEREVNTLNDTLRQRAYVDDLTGLHNRRYLTEHIDDMIYAGSSPSALLMFDIDDFKQINDMYGHQNGDICLQYLGKLINKFVSENENSYAVRFGGEEFVIFFPHASVNIIKEKAQQLNELFRSSSIKLLDESEIVIKVSIGATVAKPGMSYSELINKADSNLYVAKNSGKDQYYFE